MTTLRPDVDTRWTSRPAAGPSTTRPGRAPGWGWVEWIIVAQTLLAALLFVPGLGPVRTATRVASFGLALAAWGALAAGARRDPATFPARRWLAAVGGWLALAVLHPTSNSLGSALAQLGLIASIVSPAFWAGAALRDGRQLGRIMGLLLVCSGLSAVVGIGQFYRPGRLEPADVPAFRLSKHARASLSYRTADGREVVRPFGLGDNPGGACVAGAVAAVLGLCWALRPVAAWRRIGALGLSFAGTAVIYLCLVRVMLLVVVASVALLVVVLALQRRYRQAGLLAGAGSLVVLGAFAWALAAGGGEAVLGRFRTLLDQSPAELYQRNRAGFLSYTLETLVWDYPLGAGLGRHGMTYTYFGDHAAPAERGPIYAEIQWSAWALDGGVPLMLAYLGAALAALADSLRIALRSRDPEVAYWAAAVCALNAAVFATSFGALPFQAAEGLRFWLLAAALHAADRQSRGRAAVEAAARPAPGAPRTRGDAW